MPALESPATEPVRRALLIGIEAYPEAVGWPRLSGPRADVESLRRALIERGGFAPERIRTLLDEQATRAGILDAFAEMVALAGPSDVLLFYFAGHGSRLPDRDGDENDGWDETLVPYDAAAGEGRANDLLDDEVGRMIEQANEATPHVVMVFDCCSSGTNVRGDGEGARRFVAAEARGLAGVRDVAPAEREPGSGYFKKNLSYVALSACRASQNAYEVQLESEDGEPEGRGLFTLALIQELYEPAGETSYESLMDRVRRRVHAEKAMQTPVIEGPLSRNVLFERGEGDWVPSFPIERRGDEFVLEAGMVHGLRPRSVLSVYDWSVQTDRGAGRHGKVRLENVGPTESSFVWIDGGPPEDAERLRSFELERGPDDLRLGFALDVPESRSEDAARLLERLDRRDFLRATDRAGADLVLGIAGTSTGEKWIVMTPAGTRLPLAAALDSDLELESLASSLDRLGKAHRVRHGVRASQSALLEVETDILVLDQERGEVSAPQRDDAGMLVLRPGEVIRCRLVNESKVPIYATLLVISPDGSVFVDPRTPTLDDAIPPGGEVSSSRLRMTLPQGNEAFYAEGHEWFRWVVTTSHHDLRNLGQEAVTSLAAMRGSPAEAMDPVFAGEATQPVHSWLTRTTEVRLVTGQDL